MKWMYLLVLLASLYYYRVVNSFVITILIISVTELVMFIIRSPFLEFVRGFEHDYAVAIWALGWMTCDLLVILIIRITHIRFKLNTSNAAYFVSSSKVALMSLQLIRYVDDQLLKTDFIPSMYQYGVPAINLGVGFVLSFLLMREWFENDNFRRRYFNG